MKTNYMQKIISILLVIASMSTSVGACRMTMTTVSSTSSDASVVAVMDSTVLTDASVDVDANLAPMSDPEPIVITVPGSP